MAVSSSKAIISEPKVLVTGVEGAGKTLFSVQQADLLAREGGGDIYQLNIRGADPARLPVLPFKISDMAFNPDGSPLVDAETGDHLPMWMTLEPGSVVIVDEAHKVFPQRGPGRPPKWIEMMGEGRQAGVRFILMSQSPSSIDGFLRDRIGRHYHLERKGNLERATVLEFDHCVMFPQTAWGERKNATIHFWKYPKEYFGWYTSAKTHSFKVRIPLKIWLAILFVPLAGFLIWRAIDTNKGFFGKGGASALGLPSPSSMIEGSVGGSDGGMGDREGGLPIEKTPGKYLQNFVPVVAHMPWSSVAFQGREVVARPEVFCASSGAGRDGSGNWRAASCTCLTEQGTRFPMDASLCEIVAREGVYNPFREPMERGEGNASMASGDPGSSSAGVASSTVVAIPVSPPTVQSSSLAPLR